jgi:hypothetical protein
MAFIGNTPTTQAFTPAIDYFSGNGSTTAFTLSRPVASVAQVQVVIDNVAQNPSSAYTVSSNTITFTSAPLSGTNNIYVYYTSPITDVIAPGQGTVTATSFVSSTGTGAGVFQTSPTIVTPTIDTITSAASTALNLKSAGATAIYADTSQNVGIGNTSPSSSGAKLVVTPTNTTGSSSYLTFDCTNFIDSNFQVSVTGSASTDKRAVVGTTTTTALALQTNATERMRISSAGYVTMSAQPSFSAYRDAGHVSSNNIVVFNATRFNQGSNYNTSNGRFTAPITGKYFVSASGMLTGQTTGDHQLIIRVNGSQWLSSNPAGSNGNTFFCLSAIVPLTSADYVEIYYYDTGAANSLYATASGWNSFSMQLIS